MGGKKTCEKSREWEKERRDKLNVGFNELYKLLPDHDPSISLSKMDILRKAAEYIRQLQDQNEEIVKSGKDDVLRTEAERLRKRVAYLVLKAKDLVGALKAAGVPIPNRKKDKRNRKNGASKSSGKDQNRVPPTAVINPIHQNSFGVILASVEKKDNAIRPFDAPGTGKVHCNFEKSQKKDPLVEVDVSSNSLSIPALRSNATVVTCNSSSHATNRIVNGHNCTASPANIVNTSLTSTLGAGTLIFRDGRVITVPPPCAIIPQLVVKPQPAVIVMHGAVKRDKFPLIFPKRGEITQTTYMNKTPIPAIKTFRSESIPRTPKSTKAKKKKDSKLENINSDVSSKIDDCKTGTTDKIGSVSNNVTSFSKKPTDSTSSTNPRKRKANPIIKRSKMAKPSDPVSVISNDEKDGTSENLRDDSVMISSNDLKGASEKSSMTTRDCSTGITLTSRQVTVGEDGNSNKAGGGIVIETETQEIEKLPMQEHLEVTGIGSCSETVATSDVLNVKVLEQQNSTVEAFDVNNSEKGKPSSLVSPGITKLLSSNTQEVRNSLPSSSNAVMTDQEHIESSAAVSETQTTQIDTGCSESHVKSDRCSSGNEENKEASKSFVSEHAYSAEQFSSEGNHEIEEHTEFNQRESNNVHKTATELRSATPVNKKTCEKEDACKTFIEQGKLSSHSINSSYQKTSSADKFVIAEQPSSLQSVGCSVVNNQYDLNISGSVNPEQMFSFDDSVHCQLDSYQDDILKSQTVACSDVGEVLKMSNMDLEKKDDSSRDRTSSKEVTDDITVCSNTQHNPATTQINTPSKICDSNKVDNEKSRKLIDGKDDTLLLENVKTSFQSTRTDDNLQSTNIFIPCMGLEKSMDMRSLQSQVKSSLIDTVQSNTISSGSQIYSIAISEQSRTESFFNYDNPIATLPSTDPFLSNFITKTSDVGPVSCNATTTSFSYTNLTTQAPSVRSVGRQLFPPDPLCSIANSFNLLNNRQSELDTNLAHLSAPNTQMFQFSTYSTASSYRDPVFFANDFVTTPTKMNTSVGNLENTPQNDKTYHPAINYSDLFQTSANMNSFPNISCSFSVASSSSVPTNMNPITTTQSKQSNRQFNPGELQSALEPKHNQKSCASDANTITSNTTSKSESKTQSLYSISESTVYQKAINFEPSQNLNSNYLHPEPHTSHMSQESGYNIYMRDSMPAKNTSNHNFRSTDHVGSSHRSVSSETNFKKTSDLGAVSQKSSITKDFQNVPNSVGLSADNMRDSTGRFNLQSNIFNTCSQYADTSKSCCGNSSTGPDMVNFHGAGCSRSNNHQSVQTQQSYLGSDSDQQESLITKNATHIATSMHQSFAGPNHTSNRPNHFMQPDKYSRINQDLSHAVSGPHYSNKTNLGHGLNETDPTVRTVPSHLSQDSYQTVSSLVQNLDSAAMPSQKQLPFSSAHVFPHPNFSAQHCSFQPTFSSYSAGSNSAKSQAIYTNPTTVLSSNKIYSQGTMSGGVHRGNDQNIIGLNNPSEASVVQNQLPNSGNLPSSRGQLFSTVESLSQNKNLTTIGNQSHHSTQSATNQSNGKYSVTTSQSSIVSTNCKPSVQNDGMPNFSISKIASYSQNVPLVSSNNHHGITKRIQNSDHSYNNVQTSSQNLPVSKSSSHYVPAISNTSTKQCDFPLASMLTGLNDPILSGTSLSTETNSAHLDKNTLISVGNEKNSVCRGKTVEKQYSTNTEGSSFKTAENCGNDYLRNKENDRNSFMPIIEDVRLNSEFSNDLFSSLHVPTGGAHSDSISPTAAFLLAFPLVSTSKNTENPHDQDPTDNNTSTPTTILQIGNIEPPNSEMFHPLEFGKDIETSDYLGQDQDKCKRKDTSSHEKSKKQSLPNVCSQTYNYPAISSDFRNGQYDQTWSDNTNKTKLIAERKKSEKAPKQFNNNNAFEYCKQDKKRKNKISVNWMAAPDANDSFQKEVESTSFPAVNLPFSMDIDGLTDLCSNKKNNSSIYSWSPSKSLLPIDNGLLIPSTLPTLVGDLALGTTTPSDPFSKRCENKKTLEKQVEKNQNPQKVQNNFLSVSQLVDLKSKKQKITENKCKKTEKKKTTSFSKRKDTNEPCMYPDNFLPPLGWDKYRYKNNYSAEALIASHDMDSMNYPYQQNANYFMGTDFNQEHHPQNQQYQNSFSFSQNQFPSAITDDYQNENFSLNQSQGTSSKRVTGTEKRSERCRDEMTSRFLGGSATNSSHYPHSSSMQPYPTLALPSSSTASSQPSNFTSNTTTSVTNFNLSTIFPEINERTASQGQQNAPSQQHQQLIQQHSRNSMTSFSNNTTNSYRPHNM